MPTLEVYQEIGGLSRGANLAPQIGLGAAQNACYITISRPTGPLPQGTLSLGGFFIPYSPTKSKQPIGFTTKRKGKKAAGKPTKKK